MSPSPTLVFPIIFTQMLNYGLIRPSLPSLTLDFFDNNYSKSALVGGIADATGALLAFLLMPMVGTWSDRVGRRPALLGTLILTSLPIWSLCLYPAYLSLWAFFACQIPAKISTFSSVYSYVADSTTTETRSKSYGQVSATVFLALTFGPLLARAMEMHSSFIVAGCLSFVNVVYCALILPESLQKNTRGLLQKRESYTEPVQSEIDEVQNTSSLLLTSQDGRETVNSQLERNDNERENISFFSTLNFMFKTPTYKAIFSMVLLEQTAVYGCGEIFLLYLMNQLDFTREDNITYSLIAGIVTCLVMLLILPFLTRQLGDRRIILLAISSHLLFSSLYPFISQKWEVYAAILLSSASSMSFPATGSLVSRYVPHAETGAGQGALSGIRSLALSIGPILFALLFSVCTSIFEFASAPFILASILSIAALYVAMKIPEDVRIVAEEIVASRRESRQSSRRNSQKLSRTSAEFALIADAIGVTNNQMEANR